MVCPRCRSTNVNVQIATETSLYKKKKGCLWWLIVGWWWWIVEIFLWGFFTIPRLFVAMLKPEKYRTRTTHRSMCVCQNCGHMWNT